MIGGTPVEVPGLPDMGFVVVVTERRNIVRGGITRMHERSH